jgi:hypothetical protein
MHFMILFTRHSDRAETPAHHRLEGGRVRERRWLLHGRSGSTDLASGDAGGAAMMRCDLCDGDKADASSRIVRPRNRHGLPLHNVHELFVACDRCYGNCRNQPLWRTSVSKSDFSADGGIRTSGFTAAWARRVIRRLPAEPGRLRWPRWPASRLPTAALPA